jgi:hypothetical protein
MIEESTDYTHYNITNQVAAPKVELFGYLEANKTYFFRVAFSIVEEMGGFNVNIEYAGETAEQLKLASVSSSYTTDSEDFNIEDES